MKRFVILTALFSIVYLVALSASTGQSAPTINYQGMYGESGWYRYDC